MAETMLEKLSNWNRRMNGIPRQGLLIAITLFCAWLFIALFPYCWPFLLALLFSMILEPLVRLMTKGLRRLKAGRTIATFLGMLILFGLVAVLFTIAVNRLWHELTTLVKNIPSMISWFTSTAITWVRDLYKQYQDVLPPSALSMVDSSISSLGQTITGLAGSLSRSLTSGAWATAMSLMDVILSIVLTIMGTYYMTADKSRIAAFFRKTFPGEVIRHSTLLKKNLVRSLFGQLKSQITISGIVITFLVVTFLIFNVPYGLLAALIIGLADALPVIGAGLFLIPWSIISFILGDVRMGVVMAGIYVGTVVIRQVFEPRIVGKNLGLYPLATMIAMYAGYQTLGVFGLLGGPVVLNVIKVVLEADKAGADGDSSSTPEADSSGNADGEPKDASLQGAAEKDTAPEDTSPQKKQGPAMENPDGTITLRNGEKRPFKIRAKS